MLYDEMIHDTEAYKLWCAGGNVEGVQWDPGFKQATAGFRFHFDDPTRDLPWPILNRARPARAPIIGGLAAPGHGGAGQPGLGPRPFTDQERQQQDEERALGMDFD